MKFEGIFKMLVLMLSIKDVIQNKLILSVFSQKHVFLCHYKYTC